jgi:hypothetical protein
MSHFAVAVFTTGEGQSVDALLEPYDESITVAPYVKYTKAELIQREKENTQRAYEGPYAEWRKDPAKYETDSINLAHIAYLKTVPERLKWTDEQLYQSAIKGQENKVSIDGDLLSIYNPDSKWDYYAVGGRWENMLVLKDKSRCDSALASEVDFETMQKERAAKLSPYEDAMTQSFFKEEYMRARFRNEEEYINLESTFDTYAVITPDGQWHAPGNMGWWGMSSETLEEDRLWTLSYYDRFIKLAIEKGWCMTIVDCHI